MDSGDRVGFNVEDAEWVGRQIEFLEEFRKLNQDITANQILAFLHIAINPGISQRELMDKTGLADATVSRMMAVLSGRGVRGRPGLGVIEIGQMPGDFRTTAQRLSNKGRHVFNSLRSIVQRT